MLDCIQCERKGTLLYRIAGNFCWILFFVIFVTESPKTEINPRRPDNKNLTQ